MKKSKRKMELKRVPQGLFPNARHIRMVIRVAFESTYLITSSAICHDDVAQDCPRSSLYFVIMSMEVSRFTPRFLCFFLVIQFFVLRSVSKNAS